YIGVVNRSQSDITKNKNIDAALEAEEHFFETHPAYHHIANRLGTRFLQKTLNEQLTKHITNAIPALVNKLQTTVRDLEDRKEKFQINVLDEDTKTKRILDALKEMKNDFEAKIGVVLKSSKVILPKDKLTGGALIKRIMNEKYRSAIDIMSFNDEEMRWVEKYAICV
ncbi:dynamin-2-like protein, partial [Leptotrombidium deliense]